MSATTAAASARRRRLPGRPPLIELLRPYDLAVTLADPYVDAAEALTGSAYPLLPLDDLLRTSDIVTLHAPQTAETRHLLGARELALMPDGSVLVNTARVRPVDHTALIAELRAGRLSARAGRDRPRTACPPTPRCTTCRTPSSPQHLAGSQGDEVARLGRTVVEEAERLAAGEALGTPSPGRRWNGRPERAPDRRGGPGPWAKGARRPGRPDRTGRHRARRPPAPSTAPPGSYHLENDVRGHIGSIAQGARYGGVRGGGIR